MLRSLLGFRLGAVALLLCQGVSAGTGQKESPVLPVLLPGGGVADPDGKLGYFPAARGGIEALDLATGKVLWSVKVADKPLLAHADRLYTQADMPGKSNQVRIVVLDVEHPGKHVLETQPVVFPDWVTVGIAHGRSFQSVGRLDKGALLLFWNARGWYAGGARPTRDIEEQACKAASGVARVDLESGKVDLLEAAPLPKGLPTAIAADPRSTKIGKLTFRYIDSPSGNPQQPFQQRRTLQAIDEAGKELWRHEIEGPVFLPAPP